MANTGETEFMNSMLEFLDCTMSKSKSNGYRIGYFRNGSANCVMSWVLQQFAQTYTVEVNFGGVSVAGVQLDMKI